MTLVTIMFSSGMPIMYLIFANNFGWAYWKDKWVVLRFYKTPPNFDESSIKFTIDVCKLAILLHFVNGYLMFGNQDIISSRKANSSTLNDLEARLQLRDTAELPLN